LAGLPIKFKFGRALNDTGIGHGQTSRWSERTASVFLVMEQTEITLLTSQATCMFPNHQVLGNRIVHYAQTYISEMISFSK